MRTIILTILSFLFSVCALAQFNPNEPMKFCKHQVLDKSNTECVYTHILEDVVLKEKQAYNEILMIGLKSASMYVTIGHRLYYTEFSKY